MLFSKLTTINNGNMKKMILILTMFILSTGCKEEQQQLEEEQQQLDTTSIYGTWQFIEKFEHPPGGTGWSEVENGFTLELKSNGSFVFNQFEECSTGRFQLSSNEISFIYDCEDFEDFEDFLVHFVPVHLDTTSLIYERYKLNGSSIIVLKPGNYTCYEGCSLKLRKIAEPRIGK